MEDAMVDRLLTSTYSITAGCTELHGTSGSFKVSNEQFASPIESEFVLVPHQCLTLCLTMCLTLYFVSPVPRPLGLRFAGV